MSGLFSDHYYNRTTRKIVAAFGSLFSNMQLVRYTRDGTTELERQLVALLYGQKEYWLQQPPKYRQFLRESGYGDLDSCSRIEVAKGMLKYNRNVRDKYSLNVADGTYVVSINEKHEKKKHEKKMENYGSRLVNTCSFLV